MTAFRVWAMGLSAALVACSADDHPGPVAVEQALPECPQLDHPPAALDLEAPMPDGDFRFVDGDKLGAFQLALVSHRLGLDIDAALDLALAWRGDALWMYAGPDEQTVWMWMLQLGDAQHASAFAALAQASTANEASAFGTRVVLLGGDARPEFVSEAGAAFLGTTP